MTKQQALQILEDRYLPQIAEKTNQIKSQLSYLNELESIYSIILNEYTNKKDQLERYFDAVEMRDKLAEDLNINLEEII